MMQRKRLNIPAVVQKIFNMPHWRIWGRPEEFKAARFRNLDHCAQFVAAENVRSHARWSQYPWFSTNPEREHEAIANAIEITEGSIKHLERWLLFLSGQFVHNMAFDDIKQLGSRTHVLEILDTTTAVFEFIGRMAGRKLFTGRIAIQFEINDIAGRQLTWPVDALATSDRVGDNSWCQDQSIKIDRFYSADEMIEQRRELAMEAALELYSKFGWADPPKQDLIRAQRESFGSPINA